MKSLVLILSLFTLSLFSTDYQRYKEYQKFYPHAFKDLGDASAGEIEILLDEDSIAKAQEDMLDFLLKRGLSDREAYQFSRVGIVSEDSFIVCFRDAVKFPSNHYGTYNRVIWKPVLKNDASGAIVLPILDKDKVVLILSYRHAVRSWQLELPRGCSDPGELSQETALRELKEETGYIAEEAIPLGSLNTETALIGHTVDYFLVPVSKKENTDHEPSEVILKNIVVPIEDLKKGLDQGFIELEINGILKKIPCKDPYLTAGLCLAELKGFL